MYNSYFNSSDNTKQSFRELSSCYCPFLQLELERSRDIRIMIRIRENIFHLSDSDLRTPTHTDTDKSPMYYLPPLVGRCAIGRRPSGLGRKQPRVTEVIDAPNNGLAPDRLTQLRARFTACIFALTPDDTTVRSRART